MMPKFYSVECLVDKYKRTSQGHFFDRDTMRFFASRLTSHFRQVSETQYLFITTEKACFRDFRRVATLRLVTLKPDSDMHCGFTMSINNVDHASRVSLYMATKAMKQWDEK